MLYTFFCIRTGRYLKIQKEEGQAGFRTLNIVGNTLKNHFGKITLENLSVRDIQS